MLDKVRVRRNRFDFEDVSCLWTRIAGVETVREIGPERLLGFALPDFMTVYHILPMLPREHYLSVKTIRLVTKAPLVMYGITMGGLRSPSRKDITLYPHPIKNDFNLIPEESLAHEIGHFVYEECLDNSERQVWARIHETEGALSYYGIHLVEEDFAESYGAYVYSVFAKQSNGRLKNVSLVRHQFIRDIVFNGKFFDEVIAA